MVLPAQSEAPDTLVLARQHQLVVDRRGDESVVRLLDPAGRLVVSVEIGERGPVIRFEGASLILQAAGELALEAEHLRLHGHAGLSLSTGGDLAVSAAGDLVSEAQVQRITATLGDVDVLANDDVKLRGERVRMNC